MIVIAMKMIMMMGFQTGVITKNVVSIIKILIEITLGVVTLVYRLLIM